MSQCRFMAPDEIKELIGAGKCVPVLQYFPHMVAAGVPGGDGEEQDVYVLGVSRSLTQFSGRVTAVYRRP